MVGGDVSSYCILRETVVTTYKSTLKETSFKDGLQIMFDKTVVLPRITGYCDLAQPEIIEIFQYLINLNSDKGLYNSRVWFSTLRNKQLRNPRPALH